MTGPPSTRRSLPEVLYGALLTAYPAEFRAEYGEESVRAFTELHSDTRKTGGAPGLVALWIKSAIDLTRFGFRERWDNRGNPRRPSRRAGWLSAAVQDFAYGLRALRKKPAFAVTSIGILTLGIGATTAVFSVVDGVLLRELPYSNPGAIVSITKERSSVPYPDYKDIVARAHSFSGIAALHSEAENLTGTGEPLELINGKVSNNFFALFDARTRVGRLFTDADYAPGAPATAVISYPLWRSRWGEDPSVLGTTITLGENPFEVIGVLDGSFVPPSTDRPAGIYTTIDLDNPEFQERNFFVLSVFARLTPEATVESAGGDLDAIARNLADEYEANRNRQGEPMTFPVVSLKEVTVGEVGQTLYMLLAAVAMMLLIACANVASLFLARGTEREREIAMRSALGASRARITAQLLTESLLVALIAGALGVVLSFAIVDVLKSVDVNGIPRLTEVGIDGRILGFALLISLATGAFFGTAPAWSLGRTDVATHLRESGQSATLSRSRLRARNVLVVTEMCLATVLLVGAGLLFNSFVHLRGVTTGFVAEGSTVFGLNLGRGYEEPGSRARFAEDFLTRMESMPGVSAAGAALQMPFGDGRCCWRDQLITSRTDEADSIPTGLHAVTPGYMAGLGATLTAGRELEWRDLHADYPTVFGDAPDGLAIPVIVNQTLARRVWGSENPLGRPIFMSNGKELTVIGVVEDIRHYDLTDDSSEDAYLPYTLLSDFLGIFEAAIRSDIATEPLFSLIKQSVWEIDPDLPIAPPVSMTERISDSIATPRFLAGLLGAFATVAFLLAAGGIYGSMLYAVGQRKREMGIRLALGSGSRRIFTMVLRGGITLTAIGLVAGVGGAMALSKFLESMVFGITTTDPLTYAAAATGLAAAGIAACVMPARSATRADPIRTLRSE